jgi:DtxR family Mn-dependent transcriptional regulator
MKSETLENYLKTIYNLSSTGSVLVNNKDLANKLGVHPSTVTEGLRKLHDLNYVIYEKSYGTRLSGEGGKLALDIVRRHRIWETFLASELGFGWDEVHEIAEELEHINNPKLINRLAEKLGNPIFDPHGDPIPDQDGNIRDTNFIKLIDALEQSTYIIKGVIDHSPVFLKYLEKQQLIIGAKIHLLRREPFDQSLFVNCNNKEVVLSSKVSMNLIVEESE